MNNLPCDEAVKQYVGIWSEWVDSVGVSWDDADVDYYYGDCPNYSDEEGTICECVCFDFNCPQNLKYKKRRLKT